VRITVAEQGTSFSYQLDRDKLRQARRREGRRYLLRTNMTEDNPGQLWNYYLQLVAVEQAFKELKGDLAIRPIFHQLEARIEAHIFIAFLAYCLHVTLGRRLHALAPSLTPRSVLEKFGAIQMIDVHVPTTGRELVLTRYTEPARCCRHSTSPTPSPRTGERRSDNRSVNRGNSDPAAQSRA
jgi:Transposase DDE domain